MANSISEELRQAVLQAAIQGKLTQQLPEDGDARNLLAKIKAEKEQLIKEKKIKKEKPLDPINEDDVPFEIPENWEFEKLGKISTYAYPKKKINAQKADFNTWMLDMEDIEKGGRLLCKKTVSERQAIGDKTFFEKGNILYSKLRPYLLKILVADDNGICTPELVPFTMFGGINPDYIVLFLKSPYVDDEINRVTYGVKMPRVGTDTMVNFCVPIPPLAEQHRIVARVEELMAKIDELENIEKELNALHKAFPGDMKAALLQAAMQGKLTEQLPEDGNAEELLAQIREEKEKLIKAKKIKKEKALEPISEDEVPFEIPESWKWVRLRDIINIFGGLSYNKGNLSIHSDDMVTVFRGGNIEEMKYLFKPDDVTISRDFIKKDDLYLKKNRLITPAVTSLQHLGKIALIDKDYPDVVAGGFVLNIVPHFYSDTFSKFFMYCFSRQDMKLRCAEIANKSGQAFYNLSREKLLDSVFPLPPLAEQHRIVEKLDKLLPLCDSLEASL